MSKFKERKFLVIITVIILMFGIWNLAWFLIITNKYNKFIEAVPKTEGGIYFIKKDGYSFNVKKPDYLHFTGNLGVVNYESGEALIIWPLISGGYKYGFRIQKDGVAYEIYVDENMNPLQKDDTTTVQKVKEYKAELEGLFSKADEMWQLD